MTWRERLAEDERYREWEGGYRSYDIVKEACIAFGVVLALAVVLTILFSSPDEKPSTVQSWARTDPVYFEANLVNPTYFYPYGYSPILAVRFGS